MRLERFVFLWMVFVVGLVGCGESGEVPEITPTATVDVDSVQFDSAPVAGVFANRVELVSAETNPDLATENTLPVTLTIDYTLASTDQAVLTVYAYAHYEQSNDPANAAAEWSRPVGYASGTVETTLDVPREQFAYPNGRLLEAAIFLPRLIDSDGNDISFNPLPNAIVYFVPTDRSRMEPWSQLTADALGYDGLTWQPAQTDSWQLVQSLHESNALATLILHHAAVDTLDPAAVRQLSDDGVIIAAVGMGGTEFSNFVSAPVSLPDDHDREAVYYTHQKFNSGYGSNFGFIGSDMSLMSLLENLLNNR